MSTEEIEKEEFLKEEVSILLKEVFYSTLLENKDVEISLREAQELFYNLWKHCMGSVSPPDLPLDIIAVSNYYKKHIETRENNEYLCGQLLNSKSYKD